MKKWFVINTKPQKEFVVEKLLTDAGILIYNPKYKKILKGNGKIKIKPLFPCYEFVYFDFPSHYKLIKYTRGVKKILENESGPIPVHPQIIEEIKSRERDGFIEFTYLRKEPRIGDKVEIIDGPFKGLQGIFERETSETERVIILLNTINYQARMMIEKEKLTRID